MKRDICSSIMQIADLRTMLHVINRGTETRPVSRSDKARLHSKRFELERRYFFLDIKIKTKVLRKTIKAARTMGRTSALGSKKPSYSSCLPSAIKYYM